MNPETELDNLYGRLKGIRQLRGAMTSQTRKDFNRIVETLDGLGVLTRADVFSLRVNELAGVEEALFSEIPQRAAQLMGLLEHRNSKTIETYDGALLNWAIQDGIPLAVVFTDVTDSTALCNQLGEAEWEDILQKLFVRARNLAKENNGFFLKTNGDGFVALFRDAASALDFTIELRSNPGPSQLVVHQGVHVGKVIVKQNDISGTNVNLAARIADHAQGGEIVVTDEFWKDIQGIESPAHDQFRWKKLSNIRLKNFPETFVLWQLEVQRACGPHY